MKGVAWGFVAQTHIDELEDSSSKIPITNLS